jgi:type VI protein secretion system component Hcp
MIIMKLDPIKGDCQLEGYTDFITLDDVSWEINRDPKESFNRGGTVDLNFGIPEAGAINVKKAMDISSVDLMVMATGEGVKSNICKILFVQSGVDQKNAKYLPFLEIELERPVVKKWSIDGSGDERPTENIELLYNKIKMAYTWYSADGKASAKTYGPKGWDLVGGKAVL